MNITETKVTGYITGDRLLETRLRTPHPYLPDYYKEYYTLCKSKWKSDQYSSKIVLHYSRIKQYIKDYFAQILKHGTDDNHFVVVYRVGCLIEPNQTFQSAKYESLSSAREKYKSVFDQILTIHIRSPRLHCKVMTDLLSLYPPKPLFLDTNPDNVSEEYFGESYRKYEEFDDHIKDFVKLFIPDFTQSTTMKSMRNDLSRTAIGYPSQNAINNAFDWLARLEKWYQNQGSGFITNVQYFYLFIPAYCAKDQQLTGINSITMINEKRQLLKALQSESYRDELTLPYPERVDLLLGRLQYPLVVVDRQIELVQGILSCLKNSGVSAYQPHYLKLVNVYEFDTSRSIVSNNNINNNNNNVSNNNVLLWHGTNVGNVHSILQNGLQPSNATAGNMFGAGTYFSDTVAKSARYCHGNEDSPDVVFLLCEVQLGRSKIVADADSALSAAPEGFDSVTAFGNQHCSKGEFVYDSYGNTLNCGGLEVNSSVSCEGLNFNEYVVYQSSRVKVRYLVHVSLGFWY